MGFRSISPPVCSLNRNCSEWARIYLKCCLCGVKDGVALSLGMISVISWGLAEVPQIITNCKEKSTEGLSIAFLMTWIVGDLFNLIGCLLEPATLPTQFYMALLYTATTVILTGQTIYYGCIYPQLKAKKISHHRTVRLHEDQRIHHDERIGKQKVPGSKNDEKECKATNYQESGSTPPNECFPLRSSPVPVATTIQHYDSGGKDLYYISARSLSKSPVPTAGSWLAYSRNPGRTTPFRVNDQHPAREPLLGRHVSAESAPTSNIKNMLCVVFPAAFFLVCFKPHLSIDNRLNVSPHGMVIKLGRRLLKDRAVESSMREAGGSNSIGTILGWAMAAIYMGGRLPQICLNIRRGNVEGLNPLMFIFALIGNTTYVGSILVNSLEWSKIKPNLPWLVDAGGCVLLDLFILCQFVYFHYWKPKNAESRQDC